MSFPEPGNNWILAADSNQTRLLGFVRSSLLENHPALQIEEVSWEHIDQRLLHRSHSILSGDAEVKVT